MKELLYALPGGEPCPPDRGLTPAHLCYRVIPGPKLAGVGLTDGIRGGAMVLTAAEGGLSGDPGRFCRQTAAEFRKRRFDRIICDFDPPASGGLADLTRSLVNLCSANGWPLWLPEPFAGLGDVCKVLVSSVLVSGTLEHRLRTAMDRWGKDRVVLAVEAAAEDFCLPASGRGSPLTGEELTDLIRRLEPAIFFDRGLCAHYFTYMDRTGSPHFVLFDTPRSVREKLDTALRLGLSAALLAAPQVGGWLEEILTSEG